MRRLESLGARSDSFEKKSHATDSLCERQFLGDVICVVG